MQFSTVLVALFASMAMASPLLQERSVVCGSELDTPLCCETDVDGVVDLECQSPSIASLTIIGFHSVCDSDELTAQCCLVDLAGIAVDCENP